MSLKKPLNLIVFTREQVGEIIEITGLDMKKATCYNCKKKITMDNLGHVAKMKKSEAFCDNPCCFTRYLVETDRI